MDRLVLGIFIVLVGLNFTSSNYYLVHNANTTVADALASEVKVACVLEVSDEKRVRAIKDTWGKRCNQLSFVNVPDTKTSNITQILEQTKRRMHTAFQQYEQFVDWFVFSSVGYVLVENLRLMLSEFDPKKDIYFMPESGAWKGVKYIISKSALKRLVTTDLPHFPFCNYACDGELTSSCLNGIGLHQMDSKDFLNRERILPQNPYQNTDNKNNLKPYRYSDFAVSFDHVDPHMMYVVDYLIYQLRPFGINFDTNIPKTQKRMKKILHRKRNKVAGNWRDEEFYKMFKNNLDRDKIKFMQKIVNNNRSTVMGRVKTINKLAEVIGYYKNYDLMSTKIKKKKKIYFYI